MKTAWVIDKGKIEIRELHYEKPGPDEVVVKIHVCGICGTDLHFFNDHPENRPTPLGHEVSGTVHERGSEVGSLSPGDTVVVQNHVPCGRCESCLQGNVSLCRNISTYMNDRAGMAEYLKVKKTMIVPFTGLNHMEAAIAEPLTVSLDLMREAGVQPFQNVLISGPGVIGLFCTKLARMAGVDTIIVVGRRGQTARGRKRFETARRMGADLVFDSDEPDWQEKLREMAPPVIERMIVTSPPCTIPDMITLASFGTRIVFNGISFSEQEVTFNANDFHFKKLQLVASHAIPNWGFPRAFKLLNQQKLGQRDLITHEYPFNRIDKAFHTATSHDEEVIKVSVTFPL
jgi:L-iditol 2-dehydrogenase